MISVFYIKRRISYGVEVFFFLSFSSLIRVRRQTIVREGTTSCVLLASDVLSSRSFHPRICCRASRAARIRPVISFFFAHGRRLLNDSL